MFSLYSFRSIVLDEEAGQIISHLWNALEIASDDQESLLDCLLAVWKDSILDPLHIAETRYMAHLFFLIR
jgi:hypothetical protein